MFGCKSAPMKTGKLRMKEYFLLFVMAFYSYAYAQNGEGIYETNGNAIITKNKYIDTFFVESTSNLTPYVFKKTVTIIPTSTYGTFSLDFLMFNGYEYEPGYANVIRLSKDGSVVLSLENSNGFSSISSYVNSESGDYSIVQVAPDTYFLIFMEWIYASQPSMVSIVLIRNGEARLVFNKPAFIDSIIKSTGSLNITLQLNTVEYIEDNTPTNTPIIHNIIWDGGVLKYQ